MDQYRADLHVHSKYSRATSKGLTPRHLAAWARVKGLDVVATGDFTHPKWLQELEEQLLPDGGGLFSLKDAAGLSAEIPWLADQPLPGGARFMLSAEISSIYKRGGKTRKVHSLVYVPSFEAAGKLNAKLARVGNLASDGRPILGLDVRHLMEMVLEADPLAFLVPAHIWTPWFSLLGSRSGFDSVEECFGGYAQHVFALETGLSSDPEMCRLLSGLDRYRLVSNSDAHSGEKLGREANLFSGPVSYEGIYRALRGEGVGHDFLGTVEFFPEEGKYHLDGHMDCGVVMDPHETKARRGLCPVCGKPVTVGVLHRVMDLADREQPVRPQGQPGFVSLIPLAEVLSEIHGQGQGTAKVREHLARLYRRMGPELTILADAPLDDLAKDSSLLAEAVGRMRRGEVYRQPGFDGRYGRIRAFTPEELVGRVRGRALVGPAAGDAGAAGTGGAGGTQATAAGKRKPRKPLPMAALLEGLGVVGAASPDAGAGSDRADTAGGRKEGRARSGDAADVAGGSSSRAAAESLSASSGAASDVSSGGPSGASSGASWGASSGASSGVSSVAPSGGQSGGRTGPALSGVSGTPAAPATSPDSAARRAPPADPLESLNERQRHAATTPDPRLLVLAGPGTGKTHTLLARIGHLLRGGADPSQVLVVTFTRRAAGELRERLGETPVRADTLHALAFDYWTEAYGEKPVLLSEEAARRLFAEVNPELTGPRLKQAWQGLSMDRERMRRRPLPVWPGGSGPARGATLAAAPEATAALEATAVPEAMAASATAPEEAGASSWASRAGSGQGHPGEPGHPMTPLEHAAAARAARRLHGQPVQNVPYGLEPRDHGQAMPPLEPGQCVGGQSPGGLPEGREAPHPSEVRPGFVAVPFVQSVSFASTGPPETSLAAGAQQPASVGDIPSASDGENPPARSGDDPAARYARQKASWNLADYTDLLEFWLEKIESGIYASPYRHVLVDEVQDLSPLQLAIVRALAGSPPRTFFGIGDPNQSIYGFRGAVTDVARELRTFWAELSVVSLEKNYRSSQEILDLAHGLFPKSQRLEAARPPAVTEIMEFTAPQGLREVSWIAERVRNLLGPTSLTLSRGREGTLTPGDIAVLVRFKGLMDPIHKALTRFGVPCCVPEAEAFWAEPRVRAILNAAGRFLGMAGMEGALTLACPDRVLAQGPKEIAFYLREVPPFDHLFWQSPEFGELVEAYAAQGGWAGLISHVNAQSELELVGRRSEKVRIMTLHASKGLEFEVVFLPALEDGILPFAGMGRLTGKLSPAETAPDEAEEERLLYVGLTRARSRLYVSHAEKRELYGRLLMLKPSRLLRKLDLEAARRSHLVARTVRKEQRLDLL